MIAMIMVALGSSLAATGFMFIGISLAIIGDHDLMTQSGWVLLVGGLIAAVLGGLWYRANEAKIAATTIR